MKRIKTAAEKLLAWIKDTNFRTSAYDNPTLLKFVDELAETDEQKFLEVLMKEIDFLKNVEGHHGLGTISATLEMAHVLKRQAKLSASAIWAARAVSAAETVVAIAYNEIVEILKIAEQFEAVSNASSVLQLMDLVIGVLERTKKNLRAKHMKQCSSLLKKLEGSQKARELTERLSAL